MKDLKFDIYAMTNPKSLKDFVALLDEAIEQLNTLHEMLDKAIIQMEQAVAEMNRGNDVSGS